MAAEVLPAQSNTKKPLLLNKLEVEGCTNYVHKAVLISKEDGVISISNDRTVRIWMKRDTGQYWPTVCHSLPATPVSLAFIQESGHFFIGLDNGAVMEFILSDDYNKIIPQRNYLAHQQYVSDVHFSPVFKWLLSCGRDKYFTWHCTETGLRLGSFTPGTWCTTVAFDSLSKYAFVGDYAGHITVLQLDHNSYTYITVLKGHAGTIQCLEWDPVRKLLFSGSTDHSVIVWDIGGRKGITYELQGHHDNVTGLCYAIGTQQLITSGEDGIIVVWNMAVKRVETPEWADSDICQRCSEPFFWNIKSMWDKRTIGVRQHHCRKCGKAICDTCSDFRTVLPFMGYEFEVRVCEDCKNSTAPKEQVSCATFHEARHHVTCMHLDEAKGRLLTCGTDRVMKIWDVSSIVQPD